MLHRTIAPTIDVELDGKVRKLLLDLNSFCTFKELSGKDLLLGGMDSLGVDDFRAFLFACLKHEDEGLTLERVGSWIHFGNIGYVTERLGEIRKLSLPEPNGNDPLGVSRAEPTGSPSGQW